MSKRLLTTYILSLFDLACTLLLASLYGIGIEANPIGVAILQSPWGIAYKVIGVGACLYALYLARGKPIARAGSYIVLIAYSLLCVYHGAILIMIGVLT